MATLKEIDELLQVGNVITNEEDMFNSIYQGNEKKIKKICENSSEFLRKNARYINFKKLLLIVTKRLSERIEDSYNDNPIVKEQKESQYLGTKALARKYIKYDEDIKTYFISRLDRNTEIITSKEILYGEKRKNENNRYDEIKGIIPREDWHINSKEKFNMLSQILESEELAEDSFIRLAIENFIRQGYNESIIKEMREDICCQENIDQKIDAEIWKYSERRYFEEIKQHINADKYVLFYIQKLNRKLENNVKLTEDEKKLLKNTEKLLESINPKERIKENEKKSYGYEDVKKLVSRIDRNTGEYCTDEQLKSGEKLLQDTNGYEKYIKGAELKELARIEENLLYLAEKKKIDSTNIMKIIGGRNLRKDILIQLYMSGCISLENLTKYSKDTKMDIKQLKEEIKQAKDIKADYIDIKDKEAWELLNEEEKLQVLIKELKNGNEDILTKIKKEEIEKLYSVEQLAQLYKEIYINKNEECKHKYECLIKMHNLLENRGKTDIIELLENEFSDEMLVNLYKDKIINIDLLEEYAGIDHVMEMFEQGQIDKRDQNVILKRSNKELSKENIIEMYKAGNVSADEIIKFYLSNRISLSELKKLNSNIEFQMKKSISEKKLVELYQNSKKSKDEDLKLEYKKYVLLYQALIRDGLEDKDKIELDNKILRNIKKIKIEDIEQLYTDNMLTIETVLNLGGKDLVKQLALEGNLRANDTKKIFKEDQENGLKIEELLMNSNMSEEEKFNLIYSTYTDDKERRDALIDLLKIDEENINKSSKDNNYFYKKHNKDKNNEEYNKTVTDPFKRWKAFETLDKNYTKRYINGYVIVNVNIHNHQKTIVERLYKKEKGKNVYAYGEATFIFDTDKWLEIENKIITTDEKANKDKIDIAKLREIVKENKQKSSKVTHKKDWFIRAYKAIIDDDTIEKKYKTEDMQDIEKCNQSVENSRTKYTYQK